MAGKGGSVARILIIDDDLQVLEMLGEMIEQLGYEPIMAHDGAAGIRMFRQSPVDLVITDIFMPEKEGISTIMELRKERPTLPIIALSGGGRFGDTDLTAKMDFLEVAERVGASAKLRKPVDFEELAETISRLLQREEQES